MAAKKKASGTKPKTRGTYVVHDPVNQEIRAIAKKMRDKNGDVARIELLLQGDDAIQDKVPIAILRWNSGRTGTVFAPPSAIGRIVEFVHTNKFIGENVAGRPAVAFYSLVR